jgi:LTXXQ motif family protein
MVEYQSRATQFIGGADGSGGHCDIRATVHRNITVAGVWNRRGEMSVCVVRGTIAPPRITKMLDSNCLMRTVPVGRIALGVATTAVTTVGAIVLILCLAAAPALAAKSGGGGGHPGGGGGGHAGSGGYAGGGAHFSAPRGSASHFSAHAAPHTSASRFRGAPSSRVTHVTPSTAHPLAATVHPLVTTARPLAAGAHTAFRHPVGGADPASFLAHRHFAGGPSFRPFFGRGWHPYRHLGWIGPLFWPYAYGDIFYCSLWSSAYCGYDPFWAYGYGDIYESIFSPYSYDQYVQGPGAPERMTGLTQGMAESCADEAAEVTGWPINQIQDAVQPSQQQGALLDGLGNAIVKASDEIKSNCPATVAFTPLERLAQMQQRLQGLVDAVNIVDPPLAKFYDSLSDEQKARFNDIAPPQPQGAQAQQGQRQEADQAPAPTIQAQCDASTMTWPGDKIDQVVKPTDVQQAKLSALQSALAQGADTIKAACPAEMPATPPSRLEAVGKRLQAMLQAVQTVQPALADFYNSLSDDQKARFNSMGLQLFAANQE